VMNLRVSCLQVEATCCERWTDWPTSPAGQGAALTRCQEWLSAGTNASTLSG